MGSAKDSQPTPFDPIDELGIRINDTDPDDKKEILKILNTILNYPSS